MKVKRLEKFVIYNNKSKYKIIHFFKKVFLRNQYIVEIKFLIERFYKKSNFNEYIICSDYNFFSNIYDKGIVVFDIHTAYQVFNNYVKHDEFPIFEESDNLND